MRILSTIAGSIGLALLILSLYGRFAGPSIVYMFGDSFSSRMLLLSANTMFLIGIFLRLAHKD